MPPEATSVRRQRVRAGADRALAALLLASCLVVPWLFSTHHEDAFGLPKISALQIVSVVGLALLIIRRKTPSLWGMQPPGSFDRLLLAFVALNIAAFALSTDRQLSLWGESLQHQGVLTVLVYVTAFYLARVSLGRTRRTALLLGSIAAGGAVVAVYALVQRAGLDPVWSYPTEGRVWSTIGQPNALAAYLVLGVPTAAALVLLPTWSRLGRSGLCLAAGVMVAALALTLSRGGYLGLLVAGVVQAVVAPRDDRGGRWMALGVLSTAFLGLSLAAWTVSPVRQVVAEVSSRALSSWDRADPSVSRHLALWAVAMAVPIRHPLLGTGPDTFAEVFPRYRETVLSPEQALMFRGYRVESPHNVYLAIAAGCGIPALLAYVGTVSTALARIGRAARAPLAQRRRRVILGGLLAALAGHLVTDAFMTAEVTGSWLFWVLMGAGCGLSDPPRSGRALSTAQSR